MTQVYRLLLGATCFLQVTCLSCALLWPFRFCLLLGPQTSSLELTHTHTSYWRHPPGGPGVFPCSEPGMGQVAQITGYAPLLSTSDPPSWLPLLRALFSHPACSPGGQQAGPCPRRVEAHPPEPHPASCIAAVQQSPDLSGTELKPELSQQLGSLTGIYPSTT